MKKAYIAHAIRTPIGRFGGGLADVTAVELGVAAVKSLLEQSGVKPEEVQEFIFGNARQAGSGTNPARQIMYRAGIPQETTAYTINMACASGLKTVALAADAIGRGLADCIVTGGTENMSRVPFMLEPAARWGYKMGNQPLLDGMYRDGFMCPVSQMLMGETADRLAEDYKITRPMSDAYAVSSQNRCETARKEGKFKDEIAPVEVQTKKGAKVISEDEHPRDGVTLDDLAKLPPVFSKTGVVTAGNASGITDAAAAILVVSEDFLKKHSNIKPFGWIVDTVAVGVNPARMGIGPVPAMRKLMERQKLSLDDFDLVELNEAFACQVLACLKDIPFDPARLNVNGGSIALGHPIGCTGARVLTTLVHEMRKRKSKRGVTTLCVSGGLGMAMLIEAV